MNRRPPPSLRGRALAWLAQREHSRTELQAKLRRWAADPDAPAEDGRPTASDADIDAVLAELEAAGHLSDQRFVESRIHARAGRFGNRRIEQELRRHGVAVDDDVSDRLRQSELQRALEVHARKFGQLPGTPQERARQMRFLATRGFSSETIRRVLRGVDDV